MARLWVFLLVLAFACQQTEKARYATDTMYYLQVIDNENSERSQEFVSRLYSEIPESKYTITHNSGPKGWPFYDSFDLNAKLPTDSIMPPHLIFHAFLVYEEGSMNDISAGSYLVKAQILKPLENGSAVLKFQMFEKKGDEWIRVVDLEDHPFEIGKYPSDNDQYRILKETIIRSSFK